MDTTEIRLFLFELTLLSRKHGIFIAGCGCCGSPYLVEIDDTENDDYGEYSHHSDASYSVDEYENRLTWDKPRRRIDSGAQA